MPRSLFSDVPDKVTVRADYGSGIKARPVVPRLHDADDGACVIYDVLVGWEIRHVPHPFDVLHDGRVLTTWAATTPVTTAAITSTDAAAIALLLLMIFLLPGLA